MNGLTLKMLRKAIKIIKTSKRFQKKATYHPEAWQGHVDLLDQAVAYMTAPWENEQPCTDPRLVLQGLGYRW